MTEKQQKRTPFKSLSFTPINVRGGMAQVELLEGDDEQLYVSIKTDRGGRIFVKLDLAEHIVEAVKHTIVGGRTNLIEQAERAEKPEA